MCSSHEVRGLRRYKLPADEVRVPSGMCAAFCTQADWIWKHVFSLNAAYHGFFCLVRCFCVCVLFVLNLFLNSFQKINKCPLHFFMVEELTWSQCPIHTPLNYRMSWSVLRNTKPLHHGVMVTPLGVVRLPRTKYSKFLWSPLIRITQNQ